MADDPAQHKGETAGPPAGTGPLDPAPPPGDGKPDAPRPPGARTPQSEGFSDNDSVVSPLTETEDGDGDY